MNNYYIIDSLGFRYGVLKAFSEMEAVETFGKDMSKDIEYLLLAVREQDLKEFQNNIRSL